jgi:hypothetical protein
MPKTIQLRDVPDALHRDLKAGAATAGTYLSELLLREIQEAAARPALEKMRERLDGRRAVAAVSD